MSERKTIYLCLAHMSEEGWEQKYVKEAFDTNWVVPMGPNVNAFEDKLRKFVTGNNESAVYGDSRWPEATQASWHLNPELKDSKVARSCRWPGRPAPAAGLGIDCCWC